MDSTVTNTGVIRMLEEAAKNMAESKNLLIELDRVIGDGDLGITMEKGFAAAAQSARAEAASQPGVIFMKAGMALINNAPSTMGTLMGSGLVRGGKALAGKDELGAADMKTFLAAFLQGVMERGKAKEGEKTLIDILAPAVRAMEGYPGGDAAAVWKKAGEGALAGIETARSLEAQHGKAAVFREKTRGLEDPGGRAAYIFIKSFADALDR
jgi:dihydroxyacetone kinase-like protein